jgi:ABC-type uncharacterized transport system fused permease/ATPase subunit
MGNGNHSGRDHLSRFWSSTSGFWRGRSAVLGWSLTIGLLAMGVAQLVVQYRLNYWNRDFFNALGQRDGNGLWDQAVIFLPLACSNILDTWLSQERYRQNIRREPLTPFALHRRNFHHSQAR